MNTLHPAVAARQAVEKKLLRRVAEDMVKQGFMLRLHDGEDFCHPRHNDVELILKDCMATDEDHLYIYRPSQTNPDTYERHGRVDFIYGNDGWDVIADYTSNLEEIMEPIMDYANFLDTRK